MHKVKELVVKHQISRFFVAHSYTLDTEDMMLPALPKVTDQIRVREKKDQELEQTAKVTQQNPLTSLVSSGIHNGSLVFSLSWAQGWETQQSVR